MINIPVSIGELYDKYTILEIKKQKMVDIEKLEMIDKELKYLNQYTDNFTLDVTILNKLRHVNKTLWDIEDHIREKEAKQEFDKEFVELARSVYITNDQRAAVKKEINLLTKSKLIEEKSYSDY